MSARWAKKAHWVNSCQNFICHLQVTQVHQYLGFFLQWIANLNPYFILNLNLHCYPLPNNPTQFSHQFQYSFHLQSQFTVYYFTKYSLSTQQLTFDLAFRVQFLQIIILCHHYYHKQDITILYNDSVSFFCLYLIKISI